MKHRVKEVLGKPIYKTNPVSGHTWLDGYEATKYPTFTTDCAMGQQFKSEKKAQEHCEFLDKFCHCVYSKQSKS